ncbi:MAG TPA: HAMP domain-containing sensor histidine kinase [Solirubrobacteraceae bacterium]|nr:HAMP domain-containing sensor histidine kinase [Solirubrobacteraceae bacterium]
MIVFALIVSLSTLVAGMALAMALRLLPTVRMQLVGLALLAVGLPLAAVILGGLVMFHMHDDVKILAVAAASASTALAAALLLGGQIARRIRGLEVAADELSGGELKARAPTEGPRELAHVGEAFNTMAGNIEALFDARRQLVAWASHDLRTPVASIQAMLEAVEDGLAPIDEYLPALHQQTRTLASLIDDLFELARIDAGALTLELREAQLPQLVSHCVSGLEADARARQVRLESQLDDALPDVRCAPEHVQRVLLNLVTNALRHTPSDGSVLVRARRCDRELEVSVEDTGVGLSKEAQQRMFERFWRDDASRTRTSGGAGLGLAIARGFVEAQGGRIWAENRPGGGARFAFTLPIAEPSAIT